MTGVVVHTDLRRTGWFRCSDERINRFHEITDWSFRDNACDIPTDCPQRERAGWTGDWQVFVPSAAFLYDVAGFSLKWLRDLAAEQLPDGCIPNFVPDPRDPRRWPRAEMWLVRDAGLVGLGRRVVIVPWELRRVYGDDGVLGELWPTMVGWLDYAADVGTDEAPRRPPRTPDRSRHRTKRYLWDGGFHWGEWLEPRRRDDGQFWSADQGHVGTAYLHHSAASSRRIGGCSGTTRRPLRFEELAGGGARRVAHRVHPRRRIAHPDTQANHVRALAFGLVPEELRTQTADRLVELIRDAGAHLGTGFLATPYLLPVLADTGHLDVAYELLLQDTPPSWLAMVERGATTVWEDWEGIAADGTAARFPQPLQQGRGHLVPAHVRRRHPGPGRRARLPALPHRAPTGWRPHLGRRRTRLALRTHRVLLAYRPRPVSPDRDRPSVHHCRDRAAGRHDRRPGPRHRHPPVHADVTGLGRDPAPSVRPCSVDAEASLVVEAREPLHTVRGAS